MKYYVMAVFLALLISGCACEKQDKIVAANVKEGAVTNYSSSAAPGEPKIRAEPQRLSLRFEARHVFPVMNKRNGHQKLS